MSKLKIMSEEELRAIDPSEFEDKDILWDNGTEKAPYKFTGRAIFDYDQGLSILNKDNPTHCLTAYHGPAYKGISKYKNKLTYHTNLTEVIKMIKKGYFIGPNALGKIFSGFSPLCPFT